eukprot:Nk52_evm3s2579 gene=Nk52_evmTU3s2579
MLKTNSSDIRNLWRLVRTISNAGDACGSSLFQNDFWDARSNENLRNMFEEAFETPLSWDVAKSLADYSDVPDNVIIFSPRELDLIRKRAQKIQSNIGDIGEEEGSQMAINRKIFRLHAKCQQFKLACKDKDVVLGVIIGVKPSSKASSKRQHTCILSWTLTFGETIAPQRFLISTQCYK